MILSMAGAYNRITKQYTLEDVMSVMNPLIREWFISKFASLTEPQSFAVMPIHEGTNVVVSSPTGSGKTMTAFLSIINELMSLQEKGRLEDRIYAVYVSPLRALANDINKNLNTPLEELTHLARERNLTLPGIRVAVRSGDTSSYERQRMVKKPPHIFITTPESLALTMSSPVFRTKFSQIRWLILDELHEICDSKRGEFLSVTIERLADYCNDSFSRIGLSATMAPIEEMAAFLGGYSRESKPRPVSIVEVKNPKSLDLGVICPVRDLNAVQSDIANAKMYDELVKLIEDHTTTLVFTNTRSATESVAYKLKERGLAGVEAHHGSLSKLTRKDVEDQLKRGELKCVISSTSLELGIDIGSIDLVCQIGSPKSVAKGLQRIGRSGHSRGKMAVGRLLVFDRDDLVECAVLTRSALQNKIDRVDIPRNSLDVLAQSLVGMSLEKKWGVNDAFDVVRRSFCYHTLPRKDFISVLRYLGSKGDFENVYSKIWYDEPEGVFGKKKSSRLIYFLNIGTIADESSYEVVSERGMPVGTLSDKFVERLSAKDIFVLGGRSYEFIRARGTTVLVRDAKGRRPTVPSWTGEMLPRSFDLSEEIGRFRAEMEERLGSPEPELIDYLVSNYNVDKWSARSLLNYLKEQKSMIPWLPTNKKLLIEGTYQTDKGTRMIIFHFPFGRRTNDALSRSYAHAISQKYSCNTSVSISDDNFLISVPKEIPLKDIHKLVSSSNIRELLMSSLQNSELFKQRFRHVAGRSFMILRNYRGKELSVSRQQLRSTALLEQLGNIPDFPVIRETYNEIMNDVMDVDHASAVLKDVEEGKRTILTHGYSDTPSSFSHGILLSGISDVILMEDKSSMLRELHRKVLSHVMGGEVKGYEFEADVVEHYFSLKKPSIDEMDQVPGLVKTVGPLIMLKERGNSVHKFTSRGHEEVRQWALDLLDSGKLATVWLDDIYFIHPDERPLFASVVKKRELLGDESRALSLLSEKEISSRDIAEALNLKVEETNEVMHRLESQFMARRVRMRKDGGWMWRRSETVPGDSDQAFEKIVTRELEYFGPMTAEELSYRFRNDGMVAKAEQLVSEGIIAKGYFLAEEVEQYMLARDYLRLKNAGVKVYDFATIQRYQHYKSMEKLHSIHEYFGKFGVCGMVLDAFNRVEGFSREDWEKMRKEGKLFLGRFMRGRVRYVLAEDMPLYVSAFRDNSLSPEEQEVLDKIKEMGGGTGVDIVSALGMSRERGREIIERLDRSLWLHRIFQENEEWSARNVYAYLECNTRVENARAKIVENIIRGRGPIRLSDVMSMTGFWDMNMEQVVESLGAVRIVVGDASNSMYVMPDELQRIDSFGEAFLSTNVVSMLDPFVQYMWAELASRYGDGWYYPLVQNARVAGMAEIWVMASCVEVRQLNMNEETDVGAVLMAVSQLRQLFRQFGLDVLRIRELNGTAVDELGHNVIAACEEAGFRKINGMLVAGDVVPASFEKRRLVSLTLQLQHIEEQFSNSAEAIDQMMFLRGNYEAMLRVRHLISLEHDQKERKLLFAQVIPDHLAHTDMRWASLFRAARGRKMSKQESHVLEIVESFQPVSRKQVMGYSNISKAGTQSALRSLMRKTLIALDGNKQFVAIKESGKSRERAQEEVVTQLFRQFGTFTAEQLSRMLRPEFGMRHIRDLLWHLEEKEIIKKGYLEKGSDTLYWILADSVNRLKRASVSKNFIATQEDRLVSYFHDDVKNTLDIGASNLVFRGNEIIGAFKGKIKDYEIKVDRFEGSEEAREMLQDLAAEMGIIVRKKQPEKEEEWDVVGFYERTHPGR